MSKEQLETERVFMVLSTLSEGTLLKKYLPDILNVVYGNMTSEQFFQNAGISTEQSQSQQSLDKNTKKINVYGTKQLIEMITSRDYNFYSGDQKLKVYTILGSGYGGFANTKVYAEYETKDGARGFFKRSLTDEWIAHNNIVYAVKR